MYRESLGEDEGMLFVFEEEGEYNFWMKNTIIPLDMIWIDSEGRIVHIEYDAQPCEENCELIRPEIEARYVLEINSGLSEKLGIKVGDSVEILI